ncbi:protein AHNAK2-like [Tachyglossus aculeatus]|uniref:protein AHNAK2-like n=1 Tax=Tachyglossus aculeatus TaxID=9261 RepID=UPI0018F5C7E1|nr:protein AHNAK2-like [Tachyglossus aculeatus]
MCDCFHLVLPNWAGSPDSGSDRRLQPRDPDAETEEGNSVNEVPMEEIIRPRPQGSSPVYEFCIDQENVNRQLHEDPSSGRYSSGRRKSRTKKDPGDTADFAKMNQPEDLPEVTLKTEVEAGASGFSVTGGGREGIFVKQVLKDSTAAKLFSLREGDQLLSATIFFDNIKYEDALKILQHSEPYKVQFSLKRRLSGKEGQGPTQPAAEDQKGTAKQGRRISGQRREETPGLMEKAAEEEDREKLLVHQREGRTKRPKKERLSWPKFQSMKSKKASGPRRSHSTSDAYEESGRDVSPTSTDTESQFQKDETHRRGKPGSQRRLRFPNIGFWMPRKSDPEDGRALTASVPTSGESTLQSRDAQDQKLDLQWQMGRGRAPPQPDESSDVKLGVDLEEVPGGLGHVGDGLKLRIKTSPDVDIEMPQGRLPTEKMTTRAREDAQMILDTVREKGAVDGTGQEVHGKEKLEEGLWTLQGLEIGIAKLTLQDPKEEADGMGDLPEIRVKIPNLQVPKFGFSHEKVSDMEERITRPQWDTSQQKGLVEGMALTGVSAPERKEVAIPEGVAGWKIQKPSTKESSELEIEVRTPGLDLRGPTVDVRMQAKGRGEEASVQEGEVKVAEKGMETKDSKLKMPKFKMPSFAWSPSKGPGDVQKRGIQGDGSIPSKDGDIEAGEPGVTRDKGKFGEIKVKLEGVEEKEHSPKVKMPSIRFSKGEIKAPEAGVDLSLPKAEVSIPTVDISVPHVDVTGGADSLPQVDVKQPSVEGSVRIKGLDVDLKAPSSEVTLEGPDIKMEGLDKKFKMPGFQKPKFGMSLPKGKSPEVAISITQKDVDVSLPEVRAAVGGVSVDIASLEVSIPEAPEVSAEVSGRKIQMPSVKMPKADAKTPGVDVTLPKVEVDTQGPGAMVKAGKVEGEIKLGTKGAEVKDSKFKMPRFSMPAFGWSSSKDSGPAVQAGASLKSVEVTLPTPSVDSDLSLPGVAVTAPSLEVSGSMSVESRMEKGKLKGPQIKMPSVKSPDIKTPQAEVTLPSGQMDISFPAGEAEVKGADLGVKLPDPEGIDGELKSKTGMIGIKGHMPKVKMPSISFPKGEFKAPQGGVDLSLPKSELSVSTVDIPAPHVDVSGGADLTLPQVDIKQPLMEGSVRFKGPDIDIKAPSAEVTLEGPDVRAEGLDKIKMPGFQKPKFGISMPRGKRPEVDVSITQPDLDASLPKVGVGIEGVSVDAPSLELPESKAPEASGEMSGWKIQMPSVKLPKADVKAPKMDVSAPSVDVSFPKVEVDIQGPEIAGKAGKIEGEIIVGAKGATARDTKFKMPRFSMPAFGRSSSKDSGPVVEVDTTFKGPQVSIPIPSVDAKLSLPGADVTAPSLDMDVTPSVGKVGEKGKLEGPEVKIPSVSMPKVKGPQAQVTLPSGQMDVSLPSGDIEIKGVDLDVTVPDPESTAGDLKGKKGTLGIKGHMPKVKMPSISFLKGEAKAPKGSKDFSIPTVDIPEPHMEVAGGTDLGLPQVDIKQPSVDIKSPDIDHTAPSAEVTLEGPDVRVEGLDKKITLPHFQKPKFGVSLPKGKDPEVTISIAQPDLDVSLPKISADVGEVSGDASSLKGLGLEDSGGSAETSGRKIQIPGVKMPKADVKTPSVDVALPKAELDIQGPDVAIKAGKMEGDIKLGAKGAEAKDSRFKMPRFSMPGFGWSSSKDATPAGEMDTTKGLQVTIPTLQGDAELSLPRVEMTTPSLDVTTSVGKAGEKIKLEGPELKMPSVKMSEVKSPQAQVTLPSGQVDISVPSGELEVKGGELGVKLPDPESLAGELKGKTGMMGIKGHMPKVKTPAISFSKGEVKGSVDLSLPKPELSVSTADTTMPHVDISLPKVEVKQPTLEGPVQVKTPDIDLKAPSGEVTMEGTDIRVEGLEKKIKMPGFQKPKFGIPLPKGKGTKASISIAQPDVDVSLGPKVSAAVGGVSVDAPSPKVSGPEVPEASIKTSGSKIQMPSIKMPQADIKAPELDISSSGVDVTLPKVKADIEGPGVVVEAGKIEGEIELGAKVAEAKDGKFKMPRFSMPTFGWSSSRETGPAGKVDASFKGPQVTLPTSIVGAEVSLRGVEATAPSLKVDVEASVGKAGEKIKLEGPDVKMPAVKIPKVKSPQAQVTLPSGQVDVSLPSSDIEVKGGDLQVELPDTKGAVGELKGKPGTVGITGHMPKVKMPSIGFPKGDVQTPKGSMDLGLPKTEVSIPTGDIPAPHVEVAGGTGLSLPHVDIKQPSVEGSVQVKIPDVDLKAPSAEVKLEGPGMEVEGLGKKIKMPSFQKPKFGISLPKVKGPEASIRITQPHIDVALPEVSTATEGVSVDTSSLKVSVPKAPEGTTETSEWKIQMPKVDAKAPELDISTSSMDLTISKVEVDVQGPGMAVPVGKVEGEIKLGAKGVETKDTKFKVPKFSMPAFGWSSSKDSGPVGEVDASLKDPQVTIPIPHVDADISLPGAGMTSPSLDVGMTASVGKVGETGKLEGPEVKMPSVKIPKIKSPQAQVTLPSGQVDISLPSSDIEVKGEDLGIKLPDKEVAGGDLKGKTGFIGLKGHMPKVKMPSIGFSKGDVKVPEGSVDLSLPKAEVSIPTVDISTSNVDLATGTDLSLPKVDVKLPTVEGSLQAKGPDIDLKVSPSEVTLEEPDVGVEDLGKKIKMPSFQKPKFGISLSKGEGPEASISIAQPDLDISLPKVSTAMGGVSVDAPSLKVSGPETPEASTKMSERKIEMSSIEIPKADAKDPEIDISTPSVDLTLPKVEVDIQGPGMTVEVGKVEGEIKLGAKGAEAKDGKFKLPKFSMPAFGWSSSKDSGQVGELDASLKDSQVTLPATSVDTALSLPGTELAAPSLEVDTTASVGKAGEKIKLEGPKVKMPSVKIPEVKSPQTQVILPSGDVDVSLPSSDIKVTGGDLGVKLSGTEEIAGELKGKMETIGIKGHMPKIKMPSFSYSKGEVKSPKGGVDPSLSMVEIRVPTVDVSMPQMDVTGGTDLSLTQVDIKQPSLEGSVQVKGPDVDLKASLAEVTLEGPDIRAEGLCKKITMPRFQKPKFGFSSPKGKDPDAIIIIEPPDMPISLPEVSATTGEVSVGTPGLEVSVPQVPDASAEIYGSKIPMPSVKMPIPDVEAPDIIPSSMDVTLPKVEVDIQGSGNLVKAGKLEGKTKLRAEGAEAKDGKFKMPKFSMPSFGLSTSRGSVPAAGVDLSLQGPQVTPPTASMEMDISHHGAELTAPSLDMTVTASEGKMGKEGKLEGPEVKIPSVKTPRVKSPQAQPTLPLGQMDVSLPSGDVEVKDGDLGIKLPDREFVGGDLKGKTVTKGIQGHMPKVMMPSISFSKGDIKAPEGSVDLSLPKAEVSVPTVDISMPNIDVAGGSDFSHPQVDIKQPAVAGSVQGKSPDIPPSEVTLEGPDVRVEGLKKKIEMPSFQKPKFGVSLSKDKGLEATISITKVDKDVSLPKVSASVGGVSVDASGLEVSMPEAPEVSPDTPGREIQMPSVKMPKADVKASKVDVSIPRVDVTLPKVEVDIQTPSVAVETAKMEGEIKLGDEGAKDKDGKFKMPKFSMPAFGWSSSKDSGSVKEVDRSLKDPQVTIPVPRVDAEFSQPEVDVTASMGKAGEKVTLEGPEVKLPSVEIPKVKSPEAQITLPSGQVDVSLPSSDIELKGGDLDVKLPDTESVVGELKGKTGMIGIKGHMPKVKMPSISFSKDQINASESGVDLSLPKAEVSVPTVDIPTPHVDVTRGADLSLAQVDIKQPLVEGSVQVKGPDADLKAPSADATLEGPEVGGEGLGRKIKMPSFQKPKFGISLPKDKSPEASVIIPQPDQDIPLTEVSMAMGGVSVGAPSLELSVPKAPEASTETSGWKIQMPSFKMTKADVKVPKVDVSSPSVDVTLPRVEVDIQGLSAEVEDSKVEGEIKLGVKGAEDKDSKFKMPKFSMPAFGRSTPRDSGAEGGVDASLKGPQVTLPTPSVAVEVSSPRVDMTTPGLDVDVTVTTGKAGEKIKVEGPEVKSPSLKIPKVKSPQAQVTLPLEQVDVSLPSSDIELKGGDLEVKLPDTESVVGELRGKTGMIGIKGHMPKVKMPGISFAKGQTKAPEGSVDLSLPKAEVSGPTMDIPAPHVAGEIELSLAQVDVKQPSVEGSVQFKDPVVDLKSPSVEATLKGPDVGVEGLDKIKMPDFQKPKLGISLPKGKSLEATVSIAQPDLDGSLPKVSTAMGGVSVEAPSLEVSTPEAPKASTKASEWKIQMPTVKMPKGDVKDPRVDISTPGVDVTCPKVDVDIQELSTAAVPGKTEGEIKLGAQGAEAKDGKFKMPKFSMPAFGWSSGKESSPVGDVDASLKGLQVTLPTTGVETEGSLPKVDVTGSTLDMDVTTSVGKLGEKIKLKGTEIKMPSVKMPKVKSPQAQVTLPSGRVDVSRPSSDIEVKGGDMDVKPPDTESVAGELKGKKGTIGITGHMEKVKMPSISFSKGKVKAPEGGLDLVLPKAEVSIPAVDVPTPHEDVTIGADLRLPQVDVKKSSVEGSVQVKGPDVDLKAPSAEVTLEAPDIKMEGLDMKITMPRFQKPKFSVSLSKGKDPEIAIGVAQPDLDTSLSEVKASVGGVPVDTPSLEVSVPEAPEASGQKIQMPSIKIPKAEVKATKMDVNIPGVDVTLPKVEMDVQGPGTTFKVSKVEGEIQLGAEEAKAKDSRFKMPRFSMPAFGWSSSKDSAPVGEVDTTIKGPQVTLPTPKVDSEVNLTGVGIPAPKIDVDVKTAVGKSGEKIKLEGPEVKLSGVTMPEVKSPQAQVTLPSGEVDVSLPSSDTEVTGRDLSIQLPGTEGIAGELKGKVGTLGIKGHMPKIKMPGISYSKGELKSPKGGVDPSLPLVEVNVPAVDISLPQVDVARGTDLSLPQVDVKQPSVEGSVRVKGPDFDLKAPLAKVTLEGQDIRAGALDKKITIPGFQKPKSGTSLPKGKGPEVAISVTQKDVDISLSKVSMVVGGISVDAPSLELPEPKVPEASAKTSGWKIQSPSVKMPKADVKGPKMEVSTPSVDVTPPSVEAHLQRPDVTIKAGKVEGEIKLGAKGAEAKDAKFKMPRFSMPGFGWSSSKDSGSVGEVDTSLKGSQVTLPTPRGDAEVSLTGVDITTPRLDSDVTTSVGKAGEKIKLEGPELKMPSVKMPKVKSPQAQVTLPSGHVDASLPPGHMEVTGRELDVKLPDQEDAAREFKGKAGTIEIKGQIPNVKMPSISFSKGQIKAPEGDVDFRLPKTDISSPVDVAGGTDLRLPQVDIKQPSVEGSVRFKGPDFSFKSPLAEVTLERPDIRAEGLDEKITTSGFQKPKVGISLPKGKGPEATISATQPDVDVSLPKVSIAMGEVSVDAPSLEVTGPDVPEASAETPGWKIQIPHVKMPKADVKAPRMDVSTPSVDVGLPNIEADVQGPGALVKPTKVEGEIKLDVKDTQVKDSKFKMPKLKMPSFGLSTSRDRGDHVDSSLSKVEADVSLPPSQVEVTGPATDLKVSEPTVDIPEAQGLTVGTDLRGSLSHGVPIPELSHPPKLDGTASVMVSGPSEGAQVPQFEICTLDVDVSLPKADSGIEVVKDEADTRPAEKDTDGKDRKFKMPKFSMPGFGWSTSKPVGDLPDVDVGSKEPAALAPLARVDTDLSLAGMDEQDPDPDLELTLSPGKGGEKSKMKLPHFKMPRVSLSKGKSTKSHSGVSGEEGVTALPNVESDAKGTAVPEPVSSRDGDGNLPPGSGEARSVPLPKVGFPGLTFTKLDISGSHAGGPEIKEPITLTRYQVTAPESDFPSGFSLESPPGIPTGEGSIQMKATEAEGSLTSPGFETGEVEVNLESLDGKVKFPRFYRPRFGVSVPEAEGSEGQFGMSQGEADLPDTETPGTEVAQSVKPEGDKPEDHIQEGKGSPFKMPKFKLPSFSWSPKKEADPTPDPQPSLEEAAPDPSLDSEGILEEGEVFRPKLEMSPEGSPERDVQKGKLKKPHFTMPKISLSKMKVHKAGSGLPRGEGDTAHPGAEAEALDLSGGDSGPTGGKAEGAGISLGSFPAPPADLDIDQSTAGLLSPKHDSPLAAGDAHASQSKTATDQPPLPKAEGPTLLKSPEIPAGHLAAPAASLEVEGSELRVERLDKKITLPGFSQKLKLGLSYPEGQEPDTGVKLSKSQGTISSAKVAGDPRVISPETPTVEISLACPSVAVAVSGDTSQKPLTEATSKLVSPQADVGVPSVDIEGADPRGPEVGTSGGKAAGEPQTGGTTPEGHESWFRMPKFRMPSFGRSSTKDKRRSLDLEAPGYVPPATTLGEIEVDPATTTGRESLKGQMSLPEVQEPDIGSPDTKTPVLGGHLCVTAPEAASLHLGEAGEHIAHPDPKTYADVLKLNIEGKGLDTTSQLCTSETETQSSIQLQGPDSTLKGPSMKVTAKELDPRAGDIQLPGFQKPMFDITLSKGKGPEAAISVTQSDVDVTLPKVSTDLGGASVDVPTLEVSVPEAPEGSAKTSGWKTQIPSIKMAKADVKAPKMDASIPRVDVTLPKAKVDVQPPDMAVEAGKVEGEIKLGAEAKDGKFKMPRFSMPAFGWSSGKGTKGDVSLPAAEAEVSCPESEAAIGMTDTRVLGQTTKVEGVEGPKLHLPKVKVARLGLTTSEGKGSEAEVASNIQEDKMALPPWDGSLPGSKEASTRVEVGFSESKIQVSGAGGSLGSVSEILSKLSWDEMAGEQPRPTEILKIPKLKVPKFTFSAPVTGAVSTEHQVRGPGTDIEIALHKEAPEVWGVSVQKTAVPTLPSPDPDGRHMEVDLSAADSSISKVRVHIQGARVTSQEVTIENIITTEYVDLTGQETCSTQIVRESEIPSTEVQMPSYGFSLLKVKIPESPSHVGPSGPEQVEVSCTGSDAETGELSDESLRPDLPRTDVVKESLHLDTREPYEIISSDVSLPKLKTFTFEVESSRQHLDSGSDGEPAEILEFPSDDSQAATPLEKEEKPLQSPKEKSESKKPSGLFRFWLPSIGFSSSVDESGSDPNVEVQVSTPTEAVAEMESPKKQEKASWFRFPKLSFSSSPSKKGQSPEEDGADLREKKSPDESGDTESATTFFDAQESLSPEEKMGEGDSAEAPGEAQVLGEIVTSSARTELILLEGEKKTDGKNIPPPETK